MEYHEKLATSLELLANFQAENRQVLHADDLPKADRMRLTKNHFLSPITRGWWLIDNPSRTPEDATLWHAAFWEFCARYANRRFGRSWHLTPDASLLLYAQSTITPRQIVLCSTKGNNNSLPLPFGHSLFDMAVQELLPSDSISDADNLRLVVLESALVQATPRFFASHPIEAQTALARVPQANNIPRLLLEGGHSRKGSRLAGAFRHIGRGDMADQIARRLKDNEKYFVETNPFFSEGELSMPPGGAQRPSIPPVAHRIQALWQAARGPILTALPKAPGIPIGPQAKAAYTRQVANIYATDAYHSLSIEGYRVSPELIDRVRSGDWNPSENSEDSENQNAMAARGYWQAAQLVHRAVEQVLEGADAGQIARRQHSEWYMQLFQPSFAADLHKTGALNGYRDFAAGLHKAGALAGYRNQAVFLRGSRHVPPRIEVLPDAMEALLDLIQDEPEPSVRAVAGHWLFGHIHPFPDGNGRTARFLMNLMLASGGYPWTVIRVEDRGEYLAALETASVDGNVRPFADFVARQLRANPIRRNRSKSPP